MIALFVCAVGGGLFVLPLAQEDEIDRRIRIGCAVVLFVVAAVIA